MKINDIPEHSNQRSCRRRRNESQNPRSAVCSKTSPLAAISSVAWNSRTRKGGGPGSRPRWLHCGLGELPGWERDASCWEGLRGGRGPCSASQHEHPLFTCIEASILPSGRAVLQGVARSHAPAGCEDRGYPHRHGFHVATRTAGWPSLSPCSLLCTFP